MDVPQRIRRLSKQYTSAQIEAALARCFIEQHQIDVPGGGLADWLEAEWREEVQAELVGDSGVGLDVEELVAAFEALVPDAEAGETGAVFTPHAVSEFMVREALRRRGGDADRITVMDPAAGCGALLVEAYRQLVKEYDCDPAVTAERLYGVDISEDSLRRAHLLVNLVAWDLGAGREVAPNLAQASGLRREWGGTFTDGTERFAVVVGNPPYVRYQQMNEATRAALAEEWESCGHGNFNLYFPFFEAGRLLLEKGGQLAFIAPNGWFTSTSGQRLRQWAASVDLIDDIIDFGTHMVFPGAMTYTAIVLGTRREPREHPSITYTAVDGLSGLARLENNWVETEAVKIPHARLDRRRWRLVGRGDADAVAQIAETGLPLSEVSNSSYGLATLRDRLYLVEDTAGTLAAEYNGVVYPIEREATRPVVKVSKQGGERRLRIIYPYRIEGGVAGVIGEDELAEIWPQTYRYLSAIRGELAQRDHGRKTYPAWYAYGRSQGLIPLGEKLLTPLYAAKPRFEYHSGADELFINGLAVTSNGRVPLSDLEQVLNSGVCRFYVEQTANSIAGGYYAYQKSQIAGLGIPQLTAAQRRELESAETDGEVDDLLADIYGIDLPEVYRREGREARAA